MPCKHRLNIFTGRCRHCNIPIVESKNTKNKVLHVIMYCGPVAYFFAAKIDWIKAMGGKGDLLLFVVISLIICLLYSYVLDYEPEIKDDEKQGDNTGEDAEQ